ncbi:Spy/CpxP family protein refolding chaperone [uncultured Rhodoferax sp.]|uniref:Spy/CpxP family protein refolding chaperone n=1 Tax=uncultured Rhodoferax sp. TaxID=223188 RepID=UPI0025EB3444|nr:Spy/CpxP family protein refolding chaperone [uncultured Rhodoferax sp.]
MKNSTKALVLAAMLAGAGASAFAAQGSGERPESSPRAEHHRMDPAKMEEMHAKRSAELKEKLKITPAQEGAWNAFTAAMKPPTRDTAQRPDRAELEKLPTPERLDKMRALRTQHMNDMSAAMDKRDQATKALYAALTPEQQKVFDAQHDPRHGGERSPKGK